MERIGPGGWVLKKEMGKGVAARGKWRVTANGYEVSSQGDENILERNSADNCTTVLIHLKTTALYTVKGGFYGILSSI